MELVLVPVVLTCNKLCFRNCFDKVVDILILKTKPSQYARHKAYQVDALHAGKDRGDVCRESNL